MKVLFYHKNLRTGGAERAVIEVVKNLRGNGVDAAVAFGREAGDYVRELDDGLIFRPKLTRSSPTPRLIRSVKSRLGLCEDKQRWSRTAEFLKSTFGESVFRTLENRFTAIYQSGSPKRLAQSVQQFDPDVIITSLIETGHMAMVMALASGEIKRDFVCWIGVEQNNTRDRFIDYYDGSECEAWETITRWVYSQADRVVAVSHGVKDGLIQHYGIHADKIDVIHNPVDVQRVANVTPASDSQVPTTKRFFLSAGRLHSQKQQDHLLRAYANAAAESDVDLCIAGEGPLQKELEQLAGTLGVQDRVHLLGPRSDLWQLMKRADAFVLTSKYEGLPLVLIEAAAAECPIISYDCDHGPQEVLSDRSCGWLVPASDLSLLSQAMRAAVSDPDEASRRAGNLRKQLNSFCSTTIAAQYAASARRSLVQPAARA